ncbi:chemotaxis protein CheV [Motiliproteus coralliicola]|uniref:Chemotaxis protein CheV n=1 Tax=Motiliproteus coralliicola TaxID=2283196 RepID=A0A369WP49_9GAMM|nr:chemotaxis protein CheV [Motiliproteus coralliicola]RDE22384.1 chemotaxis protein CheV [Motiliproteus coralliicola]
MASVLDSVNQRTQLVGKNRLELLLFRLEGEQIYGLNVFKVREVIQCPKLTAMPKLKAGVKGVAHIRGSAIPVLDLSSAMGRGAIDDEAMKESFVIVTEYNQQVLGFLVNKVERIINTNWEEIHPPPRGAGKDNYLTAVTELDGNLVEILDVEKILAEVAPRSEEVDPNLVEQVRESQQQSQHVLVVDDSVVARKQLERCLNGLGVDVTLKNNGKEALDYLTGLAESGQSIADAFLMIISDIEMPEMDGYTLTASIRADERMKGAYVMLHTSLSGMFNQAMVDKVGANDFLAKFQPDELASRVKQRLEQLGES